MGRVRVWILVVPVLGAVLPAPRLGAQELDRRGLGALSVETGWVRPPFGGATAVFAASAEVRLFPGPGTVRLGVGSWLADLAPGAHGVARGRSIELGYRLRAGGAGMRPRPFAGLGFGLQSLTRDPGLAADDERERWLRPTLLGELGAGLPLAPADRLGLDLRVAVAASPGVHPALSLRVGMRYAFGPGPIGLVAGEPADALPTTAPDAVPAPPEGEALLPADTVNVLPEHGRTALHVAGAFIPGTAKLTHDAAERLRKLGGELRDARVPHVVVLVAGDASAAPPADGSAPLASGRAAAVSAALTRGGYPRQRQELAVVPSDARLVAGSVLVRDDSAATLTPRGAPASLQQ